MKKSYYIFSIFIISFTFIAINTQSIISYTEELFKSGYTISISTQSATSEELLNEIIVFSSNNHIDISTEFYDSVKSEKIIFTTKDTTTFKNINNTKYQPLQKLLEHRIISGIYFLNTNNFNNIENFNNILIPYFSKVEIDLVKPANIPIIIFYYKISIVLLLFYSLLTMLYIIQRYSKITLVKKVHGYTKFQLIKSFIYESIYLEIYLIPFLLITTTIINLHLISNSLLFSNIILILLIWLSMNLIRIILYKVLILDKSIQKIKNNNNKILNISLNIFKFIFLLLIILTLSRNFTSIKNILNAQDSYSFWTTNSQLYHFPINLTPTNVNLKTPEGVPLDFLASEKFYKELNTNYKTYLIDHDTNYENDNQHLKNLYFVNEMYAKMYNLSINENDRLITVYRSVNNTNEEIEEYLNYMYNIEKNILDIKEYNKDMIIQNFDPSNMTISNPILVEYNQDILTFLSEKFFQNSSIYTDFSNPKNLENIQIYLEKEKDINIYYNRSYSILTKIEETLKLLKKNLIENIGYLITLVLIFLIINYNIIKIYMTRNTKEIMIKATHGYTILQRYDYYLLQNFLTSMIIILFSTLLFIYNKDIFIIISTLIILGLDYILLILLIINLEKNLSVVKIKGDQ